MKTTKLIIVCVTILVLAGLGAYAGRYTYFKDGGSEMRTNRYTGQVCYLGSIPNPKWRPVPENLLSAYVTDPARHYYANPLDKVWSTPSSDCLTAIRNGFDISKSEPPGMPPIPKGFIPGNLIDRALDPNPCAGFDKNTPAIKNAIIDRRNAAVTAKWNAEHNAGLSETIVGWDCQ